LIALSVGCSTWGNGKVDVPFMEDPYQAGRTFVFIDVVTEPVQPDEVKVVVNQIYALAEGNFLNDNFADDFVRGQIEQLYPDATPEFRQVVFNLYDSLMLRVLYQIDANPDLSDTKVLTEFSRGINDALALYKPKG
jgi:hypothetical protein